MPISGSKIILVFLILQLFSFAYLDPPVQSVYQNNIAIVNRSSLTTVLDTNPLNVPETIPSTYNPTKFFYTKIITVTPSVNYSISSDMVPQLIYLVTMDYSAGPFTDDEQACPGFVRIRTYSPPELKFVRAEYSLSGILGANYTFHTSNKTQDLVNPLTGQLTNPASIPYSRSPLCSLSDSLNSINVFGGVNLSCFDDSLSLASAYSIDNLTLTNPISNFTIIYPYLNTTLVAEYSFPYTDQMTYWNANCTETHTTERGDLLIDATPDQASYEVQNSELAIFSISPAFLRFDVPVNTTQDVKYDFSILSNAEIYKVYDELDSKTLQAYYLYNFSVQNGILGSQTIIATPTNSTGNLSDLEIPPAYSGIHSSYPVAYGNYLLNAVQATATQYNYSSVLVLRESLYNLSVGNHTFTSQIYTWLGNRTVSSNLNVILQTSLNLSVVNTPNGLSVLCFLNSPSGPLSLAPVTLFVSGFGNQTVYTNSFGECSGVFPNTTQTSLISASYSGNANYFSSYDSMIYFGSSLVAGLTIPCFGSLTFLILICYLMAGPILFYANSAHSFFFDSVKPSIENLFNIHSNSFNTQKQMSDAAISSQRKKVQQLAKTALVASGATHNNETGSSVPNNATKPVDPEKSNFWSNLRKAKWQFGNDLKHKSPKDKKSDN